MARNSSSLASGWLRGVVKELRVAAEVLFGDRPGRASRQAGWRLLCLEGAMTELFPMVVHFAAFQLRCGFIHHMKNFNVWYLEEPGTYMSADIRSVRRGRSNRRHSPASNSTGSCRPSKEAHRSLASRPPAAERKCEQLAAGYIGADLGHEPVRLTRAQSSLGETSVAVGRLRRANPWASAP